VRTLFGLRRLGKKQLNERDKILSALGEKPLKVFEIMKRANVANQEACQSLLLRMRDEGVVKFDIHSGQWLLK
jgi:DNA-binding IclR family transcriptional regulator